MDMMGVADPDAVHAVRTFIKKQIASELKEELLNAVWGPLVSLRYLFFPPQFFYEDYLFLLVHVS